LSGDAAGLALVGTLVARAEALPARARARVLARAEVLRAHYRERSPGAAVPPPPGDGELWRAALEARVVARTAANLTRTPASDRAPRSPSFIEELRASAAKTHAADQVAEDAGPYNGAAVTSRALAELAALAPGYVSSYVRWLEDLACLAELPERRATPRKTESTRPRGR
jgi:hypothetical protein